MVMSSQIRQPVEIYAEVRCTGYVKPGWPCRALLARIDLSKYTGGLHIWCRKCHTDQEIAKPQD